MRFYQKGKRALEDQNPRANGGVYILTLGCPKNVVDSEELGKTLLCAGIPLAECPEEAGFIIINTCGFIEDAKRESIEEILRYSRFKDRGASLIVMGCLVKRYLRELKKELPEVDAFFGLDDEEGIIRYIKERISGPFKIDLPARIQSRGGSYSYIKISDGCVRRCSFCVIPDIKGPYRSMEPQKILQRAEQLISEGYKELILVGQEISLYGMDRKGYPSLKELIRKISSIPGDFWIRLLYLHPASITDELLYEIALNDKVCKYLDIPLQHSEDRILRLMNRPGSREGYKRLIEKIRKTIPGVTIRTTFIVGFPGEGEEDFEGLLDFVREMEFERLGVFKYSREEGTPAFKLKGHVSKRIKEERYHQIMSLQAKISLKKNLSMVGRKERCLIDEASNGIASGRLQSQAPEIDGMVIINGATLSRGDFIDVIITAAQDYDLEAVPVLSRSVVKSFVEESFSHKG